MRPGSLAILGIAAYSTFLVATMPARWVAERSLPAEGRFALREVEGTIWRGSAKAAIGSMTGTLGVDRIEWRFLPSRLLQGRAAYDVATRGAGFEARGELGRKLAGWSLHGLSARADAAIATAILPWVSPWRPEGTLTAAAESLDLADQRLHGALRIDWTNAAVALSEVRPLGSYRAEVIADGAAARISVTSQGGALRVAGQGQLQLPSRLTFSGEARGEGPNAAALERLLDLMGPRRPDGARAIEWRTR